MARADWSQTLPHPLTIPGVAKLETLADARALLRHLPDEQRNNRVWRTTANELETAAAGGDVESAWVALRMSLMIGGVQHRIERSKKRR